MRKRRAVSIIGCSALFLTAIVGKADEASVPATRKDYTDVEYQDMLAKLDRTWERLFDVYYSPKTHLFYETPVEHVAPARLFSNGFLDPDKDNAGYGAGMADCTIHGGVLLSMLVDRFEVTRDPALREIAHAVFEGLRLCATAHGVPGFVARGVCVEDGKSVCLTSSRDQYTHFVHGLWRYARSPLCDGATRIEIQSLLRAVADRMLRNVTPENDYDFLRADGLRDPRGICRMWNVRAHEAARLPMIYAVAWDLTGDQKYEVAYRTYLAPAIEQSLTLPSLPQSEINRYMPTYTLLQMQSSLEVLLELEQDAEVKSRISAAMLPVAEMGAQRAIRINGGEEKYLCACGEAALAQLMAPAAEFCDTQRGLICKSIMDSDCSRIGISRIVHLHAVYWRARRRGILTRP